MSQARSSPLLLLVLLWNAALQAQSRQDIALFFPVTDYAPGSGWSPLDKTEAECRAIAAELDKVYGFKTDVLPNKTKQEIKNKLIELQQRKYGPQDQLLLFFSMHGHFDEAGDAGCLVPYKGARIDPGFDTWLLHTELRTLVQKIPCPHILIALDACYSGTFSGAMGIPGGVPGEDCKDKIDAALQQKSRLYLAAGGKEKVPANSEFCRRWRSALGTLGGEDGLLSFTELQLRLSEASPTPKWGTFGDDKGGSFVFVPKNGCNNEPTPDNPTPRDPDQAACDYARRQNSEEVWQLYLNDPGNQRCREEAKRALAGYKETRTWQNALNTGTPAAFEYYKSIYCPGGQFCPEAEERLKTRNDNMLLIKGGTFQMGSNDGESNEKPVHSVTVSDFYLGKYEVTVAEFRAFVEAENYRTDAEKENYSWKYTDKWEKMEGINWRHDAEGKTAKDNHPVIHISWNDAVTYCKWLSKKTGQAYRLPTEAEWEYAAGNGSRHTKYSWGNGDPVGKKGGNVADETKRPSDGQSWSTKFVGYSDGYWFTAPVGTYDANDFGLHDMSGNVLEWCSDWHGSDYYKNSPSSNPQGASSGSYRVVRGGSWRSHPQHCRVAYRSYVTPGDRNYYVGFRLANTGK